MVSEAAKVVAGRLCFSPLTLDAGCLNSITLIVYQSSVHSLVGVNTWS